MGDRGIKQETARGYKTIVGALILMSILGCGAVAHPRIVWDARETDLIRGIYEQQQQARFIEIITTQICGK